MVQSFLKRNDWSIWLYSCLQGGWEDDEEVYEAASREAMEEAGVKGIVNVTSSFTISSLA